MAQFTHAQRAQATTRAGTDERKCEWVWFPSVRKAYLLPVVARDERVSPVFEEDGSISVLVVYPKMSELAKLADEFMRVAVDNTNDGGLLLTVQTYSTFFGLVRGLLLHNYELSNDELKELMTMSPVELGQLGSDIIMHLRKR